MTHHSDTPEAVGAYRDNRSSGTNWLPWIIGLLVLILLIALLWWAFSGDEGTTEPAITPNATTPPAEVEATRSGEGFTEPVEPATPAAVE